LTLAGIAGTAFTGYFLFRGETTIVTMRLQDAADLPLQLLRSS
jgi:hypothetical protein